MSVCSTPDFSGEGAEASVSRHGGSGQEGQPEAFSQVQLHRPRALPELLRKDNTTKKWACGYSGLRGIKGNLKKIPKIRPLHKS